MGESGGGGLPGRLSGVPRVGAAVPLPVAGPAMAGKTPWPRPIENGARPRWMPRGTAGTRSKALRGERIRRDQEPTSPSRLATAPVPPVSTSSAQPRIRRALPQLAIGQPGSGTISPAELGDTDAARRRRCRESHIRLPGEDMGIAGVDRQGDQGPQPFGQLSGGPAGTPPNHGRAWPLPSRRVGEKPHLWPVTRPRDKASSVVDRRSYRPWPRLWSGGRRNRRLSTPYPASETKPIRSRRRLAHDIRRKGKGLANRGHRG
ncbi:hypothetical protein KOAAANKH_02035 [Brevundimonas sp. NIBR10]|nr:hypothetical protein KOAAANKH_02035 [Brevundimonas sp. NIBR10]